MQNNFQKYEFQKGAFQILASISSAELELLEWQWLYFAHNSITVARRKYEITSSRLLSKIENKEKKTKKKNKERTTDSPYYGESALNAEVIFCISFKYGGYIELKLKKCKDAVIILHTIQLPLVSLCISLVFQAFLRKLIFSLEIQNFWNIYRCFWQGRPKALHLHSICPNISRFWKRKAPI